MPEKIKTLHTQDGTKGIILKIAAKLIAQKGYNGVSMREISEQSGVSKPTIYYYFTSKQGLFQALIDTGLTYDAIQLEEVLKRDISIKQKLIEIVKMRFRQSIRYPEFAKFFLYPFVSLEETPLVDHFKLEAIKRKDVLINLIKRGVDNGEFGISVKPAIAVEIIIGTISHFIWQQLASKKMIISDQLAEEIIEILFKGLNE